MTTASTDGPDVPTGYCPMPAPGTGAGIGQVDQSDVFSILEQSRVIPVITLHEARAAQPLAKALAVGQLRVLEVTLRTAEALPASTTERRTARWP